MTFYCQQERRYPERAEQCRTLRNGSVQTQEVNRRAWRRYRDVRRGGPVGRRCLGLMRTSYQIMVLWRVTIATIWRVRGRLQRCHRETPPLGARQERFLHSRFRSI